MRNDSGGTKEAAVNLRASKATQETQTGKIWGRRDNEKAGIRSFYIKQAHVIEKTANPQVFHRNDIEII